MNYNVAGHKGVNYTSTKIAERLYLEEMEEFSPMALTNFIMGTKK